MRTLILVMWLLIPIAVGAYHFGPGQTQMKLDVAAELLKVADRAASDADWKWAQKNYEEALALIPPEQTGLRQRTRLELCKAQMMNSQLPNANQDLEMLLAEVSDDPTAEPELQNEVRAAYANSQYYLTWLMRLEGKGREIWEREIESAQMNFRMLAEQSNEERDLGSLEIYKKDLESCVRLARMDLGELQGLPLPSQ